MVHELLPAQQVGWAQTSVKYVRASFCLRSTPTLAVPTLEGSRSICVCEVLIYPTEASCLFTALRDGLRIRAFHWSYVRQSMLAPSPHQPGRWDCRYCSESASSWLVAWTYRMIV
jgi:hypothetical protein